jgi:hypothetical protein
MTAHRVLRGISYEGRRAEVGDIVTDIPAKSVAWMKAQGIIEPAEDTQPQKPEKPLKREQVSKSEGDK